MLHKETVSPFLEKVLKEIMLNYDFKDYILVGGTALSLQIGHRKSNDIDLFRPDYKTGEEMLPILKKHYPHVSISDIGFGLVMYLPIPDTDEKLKVDIYSNEPFIRPYLFIEGIRIANIEDIAAMKLQAITTRTVKKDYWDIAELLENYSFQQMTEFYKERYPWNDLKDVMIRINQSSKCENQPDPECLNEKTWQDVKTKIKQSLDSYISEKLNKDQTNKQGKNNSKISPLSQTKEKK